jgi:hypothetical protein
MPLLGWVRRLSPQSVRRSPSLPSTLGQSQVLEPGYRLGQARSIARGHDEYPSIALDRTGITVFRDTALLGAGPAIERSRSTRMT